MEQEKQFQIDLNPLQEQIAQIEEWLYTESKKKNNNGFYCNWEIIYNSYLNNKCGILTLNENVIGFGTWSIYESTSKIEIVEIHPKQRRKGYGNKLINGIIDFLLTENVFVVSADCTNDKSERLLRKLDFIDFPRNEDKWLRENKQLYKVIVPSLPTNIDSEGTELIELWDSEPYKCDFIEPKWKWNVKFENNSTILEKPIIFPCERDWRVRWKKGNSIIKDDKVKYFMKEEITFGTFMKIDKLEI